MSNVINTNVPALAAQHALVVNQRGLEGAMTQLATGQRINSAADDAAGLAIGNKMTTQIRSLNVAVRNANDGISMLQTADSATQELGNMLFRMRELAVQSANDTNSQDQRDALQLEVGELQTQMNNIIQGTEWNGMKLLTAEPAKAGAVNFHVGPASNDYLTMDMSTLDVDAVNKVKDSSQVKISTQSDASAALGAVDDALKQIDNSRSLWGAVMNRLTHAADNASNVSLNTAESRSRIMDTDYAKTTAELAKAMILNEAGTAMLSQAKQQPMYVLALLQ